MKFVSTEGTVQEGVAGEHRSFNAPLKSPGVARPVERLGVEQVSVTDGQPLDIEGAVELDGRRRGIATPACEGCGNHGAGASVYGYHLRAEDSGHAGAWRGRWRLARGRTDWRVARGRELRRRAARRWDRDRASGCRCDRRLREGRRAPERWGERPGIGRAAGRKET